MKRVIFLLCVALGSSGTAVGNPFLTLDVPFTFSPPGGYSLNAQFTILDTFTWSMNFNNDPSYVPPWDPLQPLSGSSFTSTRTFQDVLFAGDQLSVMASFQGPIDSYAKWLILGGFKPDDVNYKFGFQYSVPLDWSGKTPPSSSASKTMNLDLPNSVDPTLSLRSTFSYSGLGGPGVGPFTFGLSSSLFVGSGAASDPKVKSEFSLLGGALGRDFLSQGENVQSVPDGGSHALTVLVGISLLFASRLRKRG